MTPRAVNPARAAPSVSEPAARRVLSPLPRINVLVSIVASLDQVPRLRRITLRAGSTRQYLPVPQSEAGRPNV
ncbi:hypothetical protein GCM10023080_076720 [Streptomyces pseudoechinosporeus]